MIEQKVVIINEQKKAIERYQSGEMKKKYQLCT